MTPGMSTPSAAPKWGWPSTFVALRHRNYRLWFFGQMFSLMGTWMQSVAQGWLVYMLTGSKLALGTVSFLGNIPTLFLMLPAGVLADRLPRRTLLVIAQTFMMLLAFALAALAALGVLQVWHIGLLAFGLGIAYSFDAPARQALPVDMVEDRRDMINAIALNSTMFNLARTVGPAVGGVVLATLGATWCFLLNGLSFLAVIVALLLMRLPEREAAPNGEPLWFQLRAGLSYVRHNVPVRTIIALMGVGALFGYSYTVLLPAYAADVLKVGETGLGALNAAMGVGSLIGSLMIASLTGFRRKGAVLTLGSVLFPIGLLLFALSHSFAWSTAFLVLVGFAFMVQVASMNTLIQGMVPDELRGRVMAVYMLAFFGTAPFASLQAGALAQTLGPAAGVGIGAVITLICTLAVLVAVPSLRRLEV